MHSFRGLTTYVRSVSKALGTVGENMLTPNEGAVAMVDWELSEGKLLLTLLHFPSAPMIWVPSTEVPSSRWARIPPSALETRRTPAPLLNATLGQSAATFSRHRTMPGLVEPSPGAALGTCLVSPVLPSRNDTKRRSFPAAVADSRHPPRPSADLPRSSRTSVYDFELHASGSSARSSTTDDTPASFRSIDASRPAGPPPLISTSGSRLDAAGAVISFAVTT
mmetsp:Transcript_21336/g.48114  ORF Transcript_21336/g.48114 Transcript_21336/m.48114 type:complete len:222 (-) Transcript_21336:236-901(-)